MPAPVVQLIVKGLEAVRDGLLSLAPALRRKRGRKALYAGAKVVQDASKAIGVVPVLNRNIYRRGKLIRKPGTVRDAIITRRSKDNEANGDVSVFVGVKPAQGSDRGTYSPNDPFYWRFVHFRTKTNKNPRPFLSIGARELEGGALRAIETELGDQFKQMDLPGINKQP